MALRENSIFDAYDLYLKHFEPYTYKLKFQEPVTKEKKEIDLVSPKDRFPHLIGLSTIFPGESAADSITHLDNKNDKYLISNIQLSFSENFKSVKNKISYFYHLSNLFNNVNFYEIHSIPNTSIIGSFILLNKFNKNKIEINLVIDEATSEDLIGSYIPRSFLVNYRRKYHGKFIADSTKQEIIKLDKIDNSTGNVVTLFYDELKDKNTIEHLSTEFNRLGLTIDMTILNNIINLNNKLNRYINIDTIIHSKILKSKLYLDNKNDFDNIITSINSLSTPQNNNCEKKDA